MDRGCAAVHLILAHLKCDIWWEYVQSESNWSDGASREGKDNTWIQEKGFSIISCEVPEWPWSVSMAERQTKVKEALKGDNVGR